jgi:glucose/arabinose dehydrogenase
MRKLFAALASVMASLASAGPDIQWSVVKDRLGPVTSINFNGPDESELIVTTKYGLVYALGAYAPATQKVDELFDFRTVDGFCNVRADGLMHAKLDRDGGTTFVYAYASFDCRDEDRRHYRLYRMRLAGRKLLDPTVVIDRLPYGAVHPGGGMVIHGAHLYLTTNDADDRGYRKVQSLDSPEGKLLRIPLSTLRSARAPLAFDRKWVYACGLRDSQGLALAARNGKRVIVATEHGPTGPPGKTAKELAHEEGLTGRDELNVIPLDAPGVVNLGWPLFSAGESIGLSAPGDCPSKATLAPRFVWGIDGTQTGIAPSGIAVFESRDRAHPWNGHVFIASLKGKSIRHLYIDRNGDVTGEAVRFPHSEEPKRAEAEHPYSDKRKRAIACNSRGDCFFGTSNADRLPACPTCAEDFIVRFSAARSHPRR